MLLFPNGHFSQAGLEVALIAHPCGQSLQVNPKSCSLYRPVSHSWHDEELSALETVPAKQVVQRVERSSKLAFPALHAIQIVDSSVVDIHPLGQ